MPPYAQLQVSIAFSSKFLWACIEFKDHHTIERQYTVSLELTIKNYVL
jgi:archaellum biogenesis ATPase FlaH